MGVMMFLRFASIICQAIFGILGALSEPLREKPDQSENINGGLSTKVWISIWGIAIATIFALATQVNEITDSRNKEKEKQRLETLVKALQKKLTAFDISVDTSLPADRQDILTFLERQKQDGKMLAYSRPK